MFLTPQVITQRLSETVLGEGVRRRVSSLPSREGGVWDFTQRDELQGLCPVPAWLVI